MSEARGRDEHNGEGGRTQPQNWCLLNGPREGGSAHGASAVKQPQAFPLPVLRLQKARSVLISFHSQGSHQAEARAGSWELHLVRGPLLHILPSAMNDKLQMLRTIINRLSLALALLVCLFIPGGIYAYSHPGSIFISTPLVAFVVGVIGGFVGLQRRLKKMSDDDLTLLANSWVYVCLASAY